METESEKTPSPTINAPAPREEDASPVAKAQHQRIQFPPLDPWFQVYTISAICHCTVGVSSRLFCAEKGQLANPINSS